MDNPFSWGDDIIDSRQIIERFEELNDELTDLVDAVAEAKKELSDFVDEHPYDHEGEELEELQEALDDANSNLDDFNSSYDTDELATLAEVMEQGEDLGDWTYGVTLVHENHFTEYTEELIEETCEMPKEFNSGNWPWCCMSIDYEEAADQLKCDYMTIEAGGQTYYARG